MSKRLSLAVIRPGYKIDAPDVFIVECFRTVHPPPLSLVRRMRRSDAVKDFLKRLKETSRKNKYYVYEYFPYYFSAKKIKCKLIKKCNITSNLSSTSGIVINKP